MTYDEIKKLLALAAARDSRVPSQVMALAWHEDLGDLDFDTARQAISRHFRTSTEYLQPAHIRQHAEEIDREQRRAAREQREAIAAEQERLALEEAPRTDRSRELAEMIRETVAKVATPDANRERALVVARSMKGRPEIPPKVKRHPGDRKRLEYPPPADDAVATLATRYLIDGHEPDAVSERLGISRKWCRRTARRFAPPSTEETP
jgi:hypothetical protein